VGLREQASEGAAAAAPARRRPPRPDHQPRLQSSNPAAQAPQGTARQARNTLQATHALLVCATRLLAQPGTVGCAQAGCATHEARQAGAGLTTDASRLSPPPTCAMVEGRGVSSSAGSIQSCSSPAAEEVPAGAACGCLQGERGRQGAALRGRPTSRDHSVPAASSSGPWRMHTVPAAKQ
jgi:hypothetical protein